MGEKTLKAEIISLRAALQLFTAAAVLLLILGGCGGGGSGAGATTSYTISVLVSGLNGSIVLQNNGGDNLSVAANGTFTLPTRIANGSSYKVTIATQPAGQACSVTLGTGTVSGANVSNVAVVCSTNTYNVSGTVAGLTGSVVLQNNSGDNLTVSSNGMFTFAVPVANGSAYSVTILAQPTGESCSVVNGTGTVTSANVTNIAITCVAGTYTISGTVTGLNGSVVLQNNGGDNLTVAANGAFSFATAVPFGGGYNITVLTQPAGQTCLIYGSGTISGNIANVAVTCTNSTYTVGGSVTGLAGTMELQDNGGDNLAVTANGTFTFATRISNSNTYNVTVLTQPTGQTCSVSTGAGTVSGGNVSNVAVVCSTNTYSVGGTVSGLAGSLVLQDNNGDNLTVSANGIFTFAAPVASGSPYSVTVLAQPTGQSCSVADGTGTITAANAANIAIVCVAGTYTISGTVTGLNGSVVLQNNGGDNLTVAANGTFTFATAVAYGDSYNVAVLTQPAGQTCLSYGSGTVSRNVTSVAVNCATLDSIAVTPGNLSIVNGTTVQLTAKGTYSGGSTQDLTMQVVWSSSDNTKATISATGLVTAIAAGSTTFTATSGTIIGSTQANVYQSPSPPTDWATFQGNAGHTGFVNAQFDPAVFTPIWTWSAPPNTGGNLVHINSVATGAGKVFVTKDIYFDQAELYALNEADGSLNWTYAFGSMANEGPPAVGNSSVFVPTNDPGSHCAMWAIDASLGTYQFKMPSTCQWSAFFAPTPLDGSVLQTSQGGAVYSYSIFSGGLQWSHPSGAYDQSTPAADAQYAYQYGVSSPALNVFDRMTGASVASITDPFAPASTSYSMFSAPMLGANGDVIAFSGGGFSGYGWSSSEQYGSRPLVSYDIAGKTIAWRSANAYLTHPAIANGVIYAARNAPATLDALSEADGHVLWSWTPPAGNTSFHRNIVVTNNLVFVSTDANVYAIDLNTHQAVWQYAKPGMLAISGSSILYIATGATLSDGNLVAIKLVGAASTAITATPNTAAQNLTVGTPMASFSPLTPSGGTTPYTYSITSGILPTGLSLNASTGAVTGTPNASYTTANVVFSVKDANNVAASTTSTASFTAALPVGYVFAGGLTWMPESNTTYTYAQAVTFCSGTIIGLTGWRLPTESELQALSASGAQYGQGWSLNWAWSSTPSSYGHYIVDVQLVTTSGDASDTTPYTITCVR
jgi:outer membrane protein assembly factor BamB